MKVLCEKCGQLLKKDEAHQKDGVWFCGDCYEQQKSENPKQAFSSVKK